jgi:hypothetical protein
LAGVPEPPRPRHFVFDRPFLVYLKEANGKEPYLAMWVANSEVMECWPTQSRR